MSPVRSARTGSSSRADPAALGEFLEQRTIEATGGATVKAWPLAARAQQPERVRRIGILTSTGADDTESQARLAAFLQGM